MAKKTRSAGKTSTAASKAAPSARDKKTLNDLKGLADGVVTAADRKREPHVDIPARALSNVKYNKTKRFLEMGSNTNRRQLFNVSQAKAYMQTMLVASGCKQLIDQAKDDQHPRSVTTCSSTRSKAPRKRRSTTRPNAIRSSKTWRSRWTASARSCTSTPRTEAIWSARSRSIDSGDEIDCSRMGSAGYSIPSIVEPDVIQFRKCDAKFILHVEKDTVWRRFNEDKFWREHKCLLTHGGGQPPRGVRRLAVPAAQRAETAGLLPAR